MKIQIKSIFGNLLYASDSENIKDAVEKAVKANAYLHDANLRGAYLRGAYLYGADLLGANLRGADLYGANLYGANLYGAYLHGANLYGANLYGADLRGAYLLGADLRGADLRGAYLYGANLRGADLHGANLYGANLYDADGEKIIIEKVPIQILTDTYDIIIFDAHMQIGCEFHLLSDWWGFSNKRISEMDGTKARRFWELWKAPLKEICKANGRL